MKKILVALILFSSFPHILHAEPGASREPLSFLGQMVLDPNHFDDVSVLRFVSPSLPLHDTNYVPIGLIPIAGPSIDERGRRSMLRTDANDALRALADDFYQNFSVKLAVVSAYRSAEYQQRLWDLGRCSANLCALPGRSEHQLGLAIDIFEASTADEFFSNPQYTKYYTWLTENAHRYGWTQSYKNGKVIDGYEVEPWHWRYVGVDLATRLHEYGWSFTQYISFLVTLSQFWRI